MQTIHMASFLSKNFMFSTLSAQARSGASGPGARRIVQILENVPQFLSVCPI
jgi:hypothetical protein